MRQSQGKYCRKNMFVSMLRKFERGLAVALADLEW
jgi:hypothetical protein